MQIFLFLTYLSLLYSKIKDLDTVELKQLLISQRNAFLYFYDSNCQFCIQLDPVILKISQSLETYYSLKEFVYKIDPLDDQEIIQQFNLESYPKLIYFSNNELNTYIGPKYHQDILQFILSKQQIALTNLQNQDQLDNFLKQNYNVGVFFTQSDLKDQVNDIIAVNKHVIFVQLQTNDKQYPIFRLYKQNEKKNIDFEGKFEKLQSFLEQNSFSDVLELNQNSIEILFNQAEPGVILFTDNNQEQERIFFEAAHKLKNQINFLIVRNDKQFYSQKLIDYFGPSSFPSLFISNAVNMEKFLFQGEHLDVQQIEEFIKDFQNHKLEKYLKSQPIPLQNTNIIQVVVGKTFTKQILMSNKDIVLMLYGEECQHSKRFNILFENSAEHFKGNSNIQFAKLEITKNEVSQNFIFGYPTVVIFLKKNKSQFIHFDQIKNEENLLNFIQANCIDQEL